MIESVRLAGQTAATLTESWPRETVREGNEAGLAYPVDTATISEGAGQRASWDGTVDMTADEADEALSFVQQAMAGQDVSGLHDLSAERVMRLVGLLG